MQNNLKQINGVTIAGLVWNLVIGIAKIAAGFFGNSRAVLADGVHSFSDLSTDVAILIGAKYWENPADKTHPHGHKRIETLVSLLISAALFAVAGGIAYDAIKAFNNPSPEPPQLIALIAALVSIIIKEILYRWTLITGKKIKSSALIANAWHHRSDALSSIPAALAVGGAMLKPELRILDPIGAVLVTLFIIGVAWKIAKSALWELTDAAAPQEVCDKIVAIASGTKGVISVHKCRTRRLGSGIEVDLHIEVNTAITVKEGHEIAGAVKHNLFEKEFDIIDVIVHTEPYEE